MEVSVKIGKISADTKTLSKLLGTKHRIQLFRAANKNRLFVRVQLQHLGHRTATKPFHYRPQNKLIHQKQKTIIDVQAANCW